MYMIQPNEFVSGYPTDPKTILEIYVRIGMCRYRYWLQADIITSSVARLGRSQELEPRAYVG